VTGTLSRAAAAPAAGAAVAVIVPADPIGAVKSWRRLVTGIDPEGRPGAWQLQGPWLKPGVAYEFPPGAIVAACDQYPDRWQITIARAASGGLETVKEWTLKAPMGKRVTDWIARRLKPGAHEHRYRLLDELPNVYEGRCWDCRRTVAAGAGRIMSVGDRNRVAHLAGACPPPPPPPQVVTPNRRGEECTLCGGWVQAGEGVALRLTAPDAVTGSWYRAAHQAEDGGCPVDTVPGPPNRVTDWCADCGGLVQPGDGYWFPAGEGRLHHRACPPQTVHGPTWVIRQPRHEPAFEVGQVRRVRVDLRSGPVTIWPLDSFLPLTFHRREQPDAPPGLPGWRALSPTYVEFIGLVIEVAGARRGRQQARVCPATWREAESLLAADAQAALEARPDAGGFTARWSAEKIGTSQPWLAEITGRDPDYGYRREFVRPDRDYRKANSRLTRGVVFSFTLLPNRVYEALEPLSRRHEERRFLRVTAEGDVAEIGREEVESWLNNGPTWAAS
jgi:hypothetical protein